MNSSLMPDCLIALDTLGACSDAAILSIAVLRFDLDLPDEAPAPTFIAVDMQSNIRAHRQIDPSALSWWSQRPDVQEVFNKHREGTVPLPAALEALSSVLCGSPRLWTFRHFESLILKHAFRQLDLDPPWPYWQVSCAQTFCETAAWLSGNQAHPTLYGDNLMGTLMLRLVELRRAYAILHAKVDK